MSKTEKSSKQREVIYKYVRTKIKIKTVFSSENKKKKKEDRGSGDDTVTRLRKQMIANHEVYTDLNY